MLFSRTNILSVPLSSRNRVLHFVPGFYSGGIESLLINIYRSIDRNKIQFDFIIDTQESLPVLHEIHALGGRVFQMGRFLSGIYDYQRKLNEILSQYSHEYAALHVHNIVRSLPILYLARWHGIPRRILHAHTNSLTGSREAIVAPVLFPLVKLLATEYLACSESAGRFFFGANQFSVVKNVINTDDYLFNRTDRERVRNEFGIGLESLVIGHAGRFTFAKNHNWLIRVFAEVVKTNNDAILLLVGDGPLDSDIRDLAEKLGVLKSIRFVGLQDNVQPFLSAMDIFLLPSHYEGFGIALLEAQANGLPCLSSDAVPPEVRLTPSVRTCSLDDSLKVWSDKVLLLHKLHKQGRANSITNCLAIKSSGHDTESQLDRILSIYYCDTIS
jgi:glycosyltransferase involved in cell wall biosynthesis